uniref:Uncharacterized protein n=1 Tax=Heterosigma akashiwo TaxID=2829 RepID=A0A7S3Y6H0_HETAK
MCVISYQWPGQNCQRSQFQGFDAFGWIIQVEKDFPCMKILGLSCSDALTGGVFCKTGKVFDFWDSLRSINFGISVPLIASMVKNKFEMMLKKEISRLLLKALAVYETVSKTKELMFLSKGSRATNVASNSLPRPLLEGRGPAIHLTTEIILGVSAVGDTHLSELVRGVLSKEKMGNLGLEHSQVLVRRKWETCFEADAAEVQEEVEIALHELLERVECNVLGLPEPVPVEIEFLLHEMLGKVEVLALTEAMHGPYEVGDKLLYIPCDWFPPECEENGKSF